MSDLASIHELMPKVMESIGVIGKNQRNQAQGFNFRGIDDVMNAVQSALIEHRVFFVPEVLHTESERYETKNGAWMRSVSMLVAYMFFGPAGDSVRVVAAGESADAGDKATSKAMSAALKYALLHTFCVPTKEQADDDADRHSPEGGQTVSRSSSSDAVCPGCKQNAKDGKPVAKHDGVWWHDACWSGRPM